MGGTAKKKKNHSIVGVPPTTPESVPCAPRVPSGWTGLGPQESTEAGKAAAEYIRREAFTGKTISVVDGNGVRGTVPQKILLDEEKKVNLMFRPSGVFEKSQVIVSQGDTVLVKKRSTIFTPGEMVVIPLDTTKLVGDEEIKVAIEKV